MPDDTANSTLFTNDLFMTINVKVWCNTKRGGYSKMI